MLYVYLKVPTFYYIISYLAQQPAPPCSSDHSLLYQPVCFHIHPTPLASPVSTSHPPSPLLPTFLLIPSPSPSPLAAPPGRLIDSVPGGGDHATFLIWLPLLPIKATSLHLRAPPLSKPSASIINSSSSFIFSHIFHCST